MTWLSILTITAPAGGGNSGILGEALAWDFFEWEDILQHRASSPACVIPPQGLYGLGDVFHRNSSRKGAYYGSTGSLFSSVRPPGIVLTNQTTARSQASHFTTVTLHKNRLDTHTLARHYASGIALATSKSIH